MGTGVAEGVVEVIAFGVAVGAGVGEGATRLRLSDCAEVPNPMVKNSAAAAKRTSDLTGNFREVITLIV